jgi:hypothetical protein
LIVRKGGSRNCHGFVLEVFSKKSEGYSAMTNNSCILVRRVIIAGIDNSASREVDGVCHFVYDNDFVCQEKDFVSVVSVEIFP